MFRVRQSLPIALAAVTSLLLAFLLVPGPSPAVSAQAAPDAPAASPAAPQDPEAEPAEPTPEQTGTFGEELEVPAKTVIFLKGTAAWDTAYETLIDGFKTVYGFLEKEAVKPAGSAMTIYLSTDDQGFEFHVAVPIAEPMATPPRGDLEMGESPSGRMLRFVHRGSYDAMDTTYEAITNFLDAKELEAKDMFIEEYVTDPLGTAPDDLVINVLVPVK